MTISVTKDDLDIKTPDTVKISMEPRVPVFDPTLGIPVPPPPIQQPMPVHRLVTIGDSLTHGFQSGAILNTHISYPAIIAHELGWGSQFRFPTYNGQGGIPFNLEFLIRELEERYGSKLNWWEVAPAAFFIRNHMDRVEDHWETGPGSRLPQQSLLNHNLAVYGWDLRDALSKTFNDCAESMKKPTSNFLDQIVENANDRAALRVLNYSNRDLSPLNAALELSKQQPMQGNVQGDGIETLIVWLGANNALASVTNLDVVWSDRNPGSYTDLKAKNNFTVWDPKDFVAELGEVVKAVKKIKARNVIFGTVPHVTIAPIARGVGSKLRKGSRYFPHYTRPWISDRNFNPTKDPCITGQEARAIDCAIDMYNDAITEAVRDARNNNLNWHLVDVCGILDRLAYRRYANDPDAQPKWWSPYPMPQELIDLKDGPPDSRFYTSSSLGRLTGGFFSLDGVHPTTIGYGIVAQEFIRAMELAGVVFNQQDGKTKRTGPIRVDFQRLIRMDTLISNPPNALSSTMGFLDWADEHLSWIKRIWA